MSYRPTYTYRPSPSSSASSPARAALAAAAASLPPPPPSDPPPIPSSMDEEPNALLPKRKLRQLIAQIHPADQTDPDVEEILRAVTDEFVASVTEMACRLAKHRKSNTLEVKDVRVYLEHNANIRIPGFPSDEIRTVAKPSVPSSYSQKVNAVHKAQNSS